VKWLSKLTGKRYRLLTEAEWEYAARAASVGPYSFEGDESTLDDYAWYSKNSDKQSHPVGQKKPNGFGLYDMHGNVWEWVEDCYHKNYEGAPSDGSAWTTGDCNSRVVRGGSYHKDPRSLRSANRGWLSSPSRGDIGFRVGRTIMRRTG
jgi:formylglycine-generating enzyme required for sulfatase activity